MKSFLSLFSWQNYWSHLRHYGIAIVIFLLGLSLSMMAFNFYQKQEMNRTKSEFDRMADHRFLRIKDILHADLEQLELIKQFFSASDQITQEDFHTFVRISFHYHPSLIALGWIKANESDTSFPPSSIGLEFMDHTSPSSKPQIFLLTYLERANRDHPLQISSSDYGTFINFLKKSSQVPTVTVSTAIDFFQEGKKRGFFLFKPIFLQELEHSH